MRTSKTPLPTPAGSQPSAVQVWPAQRTRVHVQADYFNEPHGGSQPLQWEGAIEAGRPAQEPWGLGAGWSASLSPNVVRARRKRHRRAQEGGSRVRGRHPVSGRACWPLQTAFWILLVWFAGASRGSITWGPTRGGPRHSWAGLNSGLQRAHQSENHWPGG